MECVDSTTTHKAFTTGSVTSLALNGKRCQLHRLCASLTEPYGASPRYFLMCLARALSISLWRGTGCF